MRADSICYLEDNEAKAGCENQVGYVAQIVCDDCSGTGKKKIFRCKSCRGNGYISKNLRLDIVVPPGTLDGDRLSYTVFPEADSLLMPARYTIRASVQENQMESSFVGSFLGDIFGSTFTDPQDICQPITLKKQQAKIGPYLLKYQMHKLCDSCEGTGEAVKEESMPCGMCSGQGVIEQRLKTAFGQNISRSRCENCKGKGRIIVNPCPECNGEGFINVNDSIEIAAEDQINGKRIFYFNKGHFIDQQKRGKLFVDVTIKQ